VEEDPEKWWITQIPRLPKVTSVKPDSSGILEAYAESDGEDIDSLDEFPPVQAQTSAKTSSGSSVSDWYSSCTEEEG
jgi:hypothetical protein